MLMDDAWGIVFHHEKFMYSVSAQQLLVPFGAELLQIHHLWRVDTSLIASGGQQQQQQQHKHIGLYPYNSSSTWTNLALQLAVQMLMTGDACCHWGKARPLYVAIAIRTNTRFGSCCNEKFHDDKQPTSVNRRQCCANSSRGSLILLKRRFEDETYYFSIPQ